MAKIETIAIEVDHLEMAYGDFVIQRDLNFLVHAGEVFIIMGDSGSGKTTLLRHLIGLQRPAKGEIRYGDTNFWALDEEERRHFSRRFGVLYQSGALWSSMTLAQNVALPLKEHTDYTAREMIDLVSFKLSLVGLAGFEDFYPSEISGGMRKRAGLARAMALDPDILFFDEPSAGLDPISSKRLDDLILELRDSLGSTIVVVTHELASIFTIADNAVFVDSEAKTQTALGNPKELRDHPPSAKIGEFLSRGDSDKTLIGVGP
ncbi:MAG: ATP-binding cassette domain-containing protein [Acidiferrobacterales bacterium]